MNLQISTGLKTLYMHALAQYAAAYPGGVLRVFSGTQPSTSDQAENQHGGVRIGVVTRNGLPVGYAGSELNLVQTGPFLVNRPEDEWVLTPLASGAARWCRYCVDPNDDGGVNFGAVRIDGDVGAGDSFNLQLPSTSLVLGTIVGPLSYFYTIPPIVTA